MSEPEGNAARARQWRADAAVDIEDSRLILAGRATNLRNAASLCQQSVEKLIKGFLVAHGIDFPKTHDIARLLDEFVSPVDEELATAAEAARQLSVYAVAARYPDFDEAIGVDVARQLLDVAEEAWALFEPRIMELIAAEEIGQDESAATQVAPDDDGDRGEDGGDAGH